MIDEKILKQAEYMCSNIIIYLKRGAGDVNKAESTAYNLKVLLEKYRELRECLKY